MMANTTKKEQQVEEQAKEVQETEAQEKEVQETEAQAREKYLMEKVKVKFKPLRGKDVDQKIYVNVNGETFLIQRGVEVEVPRYVLQVLETSEKAQDEVDEYIRKASGAAE